MPYIKRYVQVLPATTPNVAFTVTHNLDNTDIESVTIFPEEEGSPMPSFSWSVVDQDKVRITSVQNLSGSWIVVKAV